MHSGKLVFAQLMAQLPLHTFRQCVASYPSRYPTLTFSHLDQFLCLAFAQLTYRESLRSNIPTFIHISDGKMQIQSTLSSHLLVRRGQVHWSALRLDYRANRTEGAQGLSATSEAHQVLRCRARQTSGFSNQQLRFASAHHRSALSLPMAGRTTLQMDKTASSDQEVLRHNQERSEDTNMDCHHRLRSGCHRQKTAQYRCFTLHNPTDFVVSRFINIDIY